ncbi:unnamed protein product, partial [Rotaria magnacalcarata]
ETLLKFCDELRSNLILTTGGTGISSDNITLEHLLLERVQIIAILRRLRSINYVGMDIVEVYPPYAYDQSNIASVAAATIGYRLASLLRDKQKN